MFWKRKISHEEKYRRDWSERPDWIVVHLRHGGYAVRKKVSDFIPPCGFLPMTRLYRYEDRHTCRDRRSADRWLKAELAGDKIVYPEQPQ